jgi:hypothetical protein
MVPSALPFFRPSGGSIRIMRSLRQIAPGRLATLFLVGLPLAATTALPSDALAEWPPPVSATAADMADPQYWPNDPGYAYSADSNGQWNYYSFIPQPSGTVMPRPEETASGMSIDLAWRHTIGDPRVAIVITDSGINWDEGDLIEKVRINFRELGAHKPTLADGSPCGDLDPAKVFFGTPTAEELATLTGFDCNGDGIVSVSDYAATVGLTPEASDGHPKGDRNNNGVLDAGDLIANFSDAIDDDQNGYVDDIAGWDFMKNDNDPYDDTRYGHGTGEARDSVSQTNNGQGRAGGCPECRFVPTRVGDSFITDENEFGKAVVYAADNEVSLVQCALGTVNRTRFAQAALDYAYAKGVLVVASMADENSRHHNLPAASNHTLPVHAIQFDGPSATRSNTYLAYHPCSNYGGQNYLSASGTGCSSQATGELSGISGLVFSAGLKAGLSPRLSGAEAAQIFFATADDIDVPESRVPDAPYRWSHSGFDQRFGYGRVNANSAVEAVLAGRIPPEVDITSPQWFEILYKDQVTAPIDIVGSVGAKRASSYDYVAEWAPGVQPLDGEFKVFHEMKNIDPSVVVGADGQPLASLDIRGIDPTHERDVDSPLGENDYTITVRVRATAHYGGDIGDVPGELRRTYYVYSDPTLVKGFPLWVEDSGEASPKMADIDGDGVRDLIYPTAGGRVYGWKLGPNGPEALPGFPIDLGIVDGFVSPPPAPNVPVYLAAPAYASGDIDVGLAREATSIAPAIGDLEGDGTQEIVVSTWAGTIYVFGSDGALRSGYPLRLPDVPSCNPDPSAPPVTPCMSTETRIARGAFAAPVLEDLDKDGKLDIIQAAFDGKIYVFHGDGTPMEGWPVTVHYTGDLSEEPQTNRILTTPAVGDFNGDGIAELLVGSNEKLGAGGQSGAIYLIDGRGNNAPGGAVLPGWPITMTSFELFPLVAEGVPNAGVIGTFDGAPAAVMHGNATPPIILPKDPGTQAKLNVTPSNALPVHEDPNFEGQTARGVYPASYFGPLTKASQPNTMLPLFAQPSLGDIDQDGFADVIAAGGSLNMAINLQSTQGDTNLKSEHLVAVWSGKTGAMLPASPFVLEDYVFFNSQAVADLNNDDYPEVLSASGGYFLHAFDGCGREPEGFPKFTGQWTIPTPAIGDLDGDGKLEVATGTRSGWLYVWRTEGKSDGIIEWESFHHDNRNTGNLDAPLEQGTKKKAKTPLTEAFCKAAEAPPAGPEVLDVTGGCDGCAVADSDAETDGRALAAIALIGASLGLRRRRDGRR